MKKENQSKCICEGNWRAIISESKDLIDRQYKDEKGEVYLFFGVTHGSDDYYYSLFGVDNKKLILLSCVGNIESYGYKLLRKNSKKTRI